jgi:hypothetical protein
VTPTSLQPSRVWPAALLLAALLAAAPPLAAQEEGEAAAFCSVVGVKTEQLSNAARVTVNADGVLDATADWREFWEEEAGGGSHRRTSKRFTIRLANAKSAIGSFVDVGLYPISHLELSVPAGAPQGVGLDLTVVLLSPGRIRRVRLHQFGMGSGEETGGVGLDIWLTRNRRSLIITARSDRYVDLTQVGKERAVEAPQERRCAVHFAQDLLWVDAENAPSSELFGEISRAAGVKIVQSGVVDRHVSAYLPGMPVQAALEAIGRGYGLCIQPFEGAYTVTDGAARSPSVFSASVTRAIPVRNIRAETAVDLLPNFLTQYVHPEPTRNALIATGPSCMLDKLEQDLRTIDRPAPRIEVRAIAVEADDLSDLEAALGFRSVQGTTAWGGDSGTGDITFHVARDLAEGVMARLTALRETARFKVVSESHATAGNGGNAVLFAGDTHFFPFRTAWSYRQEVILQHQDVGVSLSVAPVTGDGGNITSFVNLDVKNVISVDSEGLPLVSSRHARGTVRARDGDTVYIGGVELEERQRTRRRIPILCDLPIIGKAFTSRSTRTVRQEMGFFITLHVVTEDETRGASAQASPATIDGG